MTTQRMTLGEQMVWATSFSTMLVAGCSRGTAARLATRHVRHLRAVKDEDLARSANRPADPQECAQQHIDALADVEQMRGDT